MFAPQREVMGRFLAHGYSRSHLHDRGLRPGVFLLVARLLREKRAPANTFAWLLGIILVPYVGVPLFLLIGDRKLRRVAKNKSRLLPTLSGSGAGPVPPLAPAVAATVTAAGAGPPVGGNRVTLLATGEEEFATLERHIREARHSIHITTFILSRDETGRRLVQLLAERARAGVKVRLLLDAFGCFISSFVFVNPIREAGGEVGRFMPVLPFGSRTSANLRLHRKIALFDHTTAMIGGRNLATEYMGPSPLRKRWCDLGTVIEGPAAAPPGTRSSSPDWCFATRQPPEPAPRGSSRPMPPSPAARPSYRWSQADRTSPAIRSTRASSP